jgi:hypothetical protein
MSRWRKYSERIISEVEAKHGVAWDTDATIFLLSFFIEQVSTQRQFRQFLEKQAKVEKEALLEEQETQGSPVKHSGLMPPTRKSLRR